jgi:hypothetical protein
VRNQPALARVAASGIRPGAASPALARHRNRRRRSHLDTRALPEEIERLWRWPVLCLAGTQVRPHPRAPTAMSSPMMDGVADTALRLAAAFALADSHGVRVMRHTGYLSLSRHLPGFLSPHNGRGCRFSISHHNIPAPTYRLNSPRPVDVSTAGNRDAFLGNVSRCGREHHTDLPHRPRRGSKTRVKH